MVLTVPDGVAKPGDKLKVNLWTVGKKRSVLVGAYTRGRPLAHQRAVLEPGKPTELVLDPGDAKLGGVTRVTVFEEPADAEGRVNLKPVAERLVYRQQGEVLKLRFDATKPKGQPRGGAFAPGERVELTVHAYDEAGRPKPAVLWAAVVNQSVVAMADEKSDRLLPTHFLLGGEVQNGEELEHADFLLTDHPKAAAGLDLLLGTQGWRRFAEQAPGEFKSRHGGRRPTRCWWRWASGSVHAGCGGPTPGGCSRSTGRSTRPRWSNWTPPRRTSGTGRVHRRAAGRADPGRGRTTSRG